MPEWADGNCMIVCSLTFLGLMGACISCYLIHKHMSVGVLHPTGLAIWLVAVAALLGNCVLIFRGLYEKFFERGLDAYY